MAAHGTRRRQGGWRSARHKQQVGSFRGGRMEARGYSAAVGEGGDEKERKNRTGIKPHGLQNLGGKPSGRRQKTGGGELQPKALPHTHTGPASPCARWRRWPGMPGLCWHARPPPNVDTYCWPPPNPPCTAKVCRRLPPLAGSGPACRCSAPRSCQRPAAGAGEQRLAPPLLAPPREAGGPCAGPAGPHRDVTFW